MKRSLPWVAAGTVAVLLAGHYALTSGSRFYLPEAVRHLEPGISRDEVMAKIPDDWMWDPFWGNDGSPWKMYATKSSTTNIRTDTISGPAGLAHWTFEIHYRPDETVNLVTVAYRDWLTDLRDEAKSFLWSWKYSSTP